MPDIYLARSTRRDTRSDPDPVAWFGESVLDSIEDMNASVRVLRYVERDILNKHGASMRRTPAGAGMSLLEHMLPAGHLWYTLPDEEQRVIRMNLTQACVQHFAQPGDIDAIFPYDARAAYMSCCHHVPVFFNQIAVPEYLGAAGHFYQHDNHTTYAGFTLGFYRVHVTVPHDWQHVGLAPKKRPGFLYADYPRQPNEEWETWIDGAEVQILQQARWPFAIRERILFPDAIAKYQENATAATKCVRLGKDRRFDPLGPWIDELASHILKIGDVPASRERYFLRQAVRAMAYHTATGVFHSRGSDVQLSVPPGEPVPDEVPAWAEMGVDENGHTLYTWKEAHNGIMRRWDHPEWSAHIWGKWRARTLRKALKVPFSDLLHIQTDAIYTSATLPSQAVTDLFYDDGKIGGFRIKDEPVLFSSPQAAPATWDDLQEMMMNGSR